MKSITLATLVGLLFIGMAWGQDSVKLPYLFTEDQNLKQTDFPEVIKPNDAVNNDSWLNAPMTRLEYLLSQIETRLNSPSFVGRMSKFASANFDPVMEGFGAHVKAEARYDNKFGKVIVSVELSDLGKPKHPMRIMCDTILKELATEVPQDVNSNVYHNRYMKVLMRENYKKYDRMIQTLADNIIHLGVVTTSTADWNEIHNLTCMKENKASPIFYRKDSYNLN